MSSSTSQPNGERILVIVPAYNEEGSIASVLSAIGRSLPGLDVLVINDGSQDGTPQVVARHDIEKIDLSVNVGIGGAMQTGLKCASRREYGAALQVDGDGQHDPEFAPQLLDAVRRGADLAIGSRFLEDRTEGFRSTAARRLGIRMLSRTLQLVTGISVTDPTSGFRAFSRRAIEVFARHYPPDFPEPESILLARQSGLTVREVPVIMRPRIHGTSSIRGSYSAYYMVKVMLALLIHAAGTPRFPAEAES